MSVKIWTLASAVAATFFISASAHATGKSVIGTLGQSVKPTHIYRSMSRRGRVLTPVAAFRYLVINKTSDEDWYSVVMSDGSTGYIRTDQVAQLPYEVTAGRPKADGTPAAGTVTTNPVVPPPVASGAASRSGAPVRLPAVESTGGSTTAKQRAIEESFRYIGTPYRWGGTDLTGGIDCSAFVMKLYSKEGINLPRTAREQALVGTKVERLEDLQPGDRLSFWSSKRGAIGHTGIFLGFFKDGGAYFIHSSSGRHGVATDDLRDSKWRRILVDARRD